MEISNTLLCELDDFVDKLDNSDCVLDRHIAIREAARLLICLTHDEYYDSTDPFDQSYAIIACACQTFVKSR